MSADPQTLEAWAEHVGDEPSGGLAAHRVVDPYDQPLPVAVEGAEVWPEAIVIAEADGCPAAVLADMRARDQVGRARYGMPLRRGDGRDHGADAYQEALDLYVYLVAVREAPTELVLDALDLAIRVRAMLEAERDP